MVTESTLLRQQVSVPAWRAASVPAETLLRFPCPGEETALWFAHVLAQDPATLLQITKTLKR